MDRGAPQSHNHRTNGDRQNLLCKCRNLFEVIDSRDCKRSTMIVSQLPVKSWYELFTENTYADACLDRMIHKAYRLQMEGKNMRNPSK